jgi:hypothetical protein
MLAVVATAATLMTVTSGVPARAAAGTLKLFAQNDEVTLRRPAGRPAFLNAGVFVAAIGGAFEIHANRADYASPIVGSQWADGAKVQDLDASLVDGWDGLHGLFHVRVKNPAGNVVIDEDLDWCPGGYSNTRYDDSGPDLPVLPAFGCSVMPFTLGTVWGIDQGWATPLNSRYGDGTQRVYLDGRDGEYHVTYSFPQSVIDTFGMNPDDSRARVTVHLETKAHREAAGRRPRQAPAEESPAPRVPTDLNPDPSTRPDLAALPAWAMRINRPRSGGEYLAFAANLWNAGPSPMVVEGFREPDSETMDAYEYFYDGDTPVSRAPVGTFEFDTREGHHHWHMEQFAGYALLNADQTEVVRSTKQSFCLFPTDVIDLTVPRADWATGFYGGGGLSTACGGRDAIWIREALPAGWGDTYYQYVAGQSFRISGLPNGRYWVQVTADPSGQMIETTKDNNVSLRRVIIRGQPGHRYVVVPPYQLIDSDGCRRC